MNEYIGIDISKSTLQVYLSKVDQDLEIDNSPQALKALVAKIKKHYGKKANAVWIFEPTGSYSTTVMRFAHEHAIACFIVKPSQSAAYAKSIKRRNKTDRVDARMLSSMHTLAKEGEIAVPAHDAHLSRIKNAMRYYKSLIKERIAKTNQLEAALHRNDDPFILRRLRSAIKSLKQEEKEILEHIQKIIDANDEYKSRFDAICSFKGIGAVSGMVLFEMFMRHKEASAKEITALCGLDPIETSSGTSLKRRSSISKQGSRLVRSTLFMPALIAIQHNTDMRALYGRLKENGKHSTVAQVAVMRKMVTITFALFKKQERYVEGLHVTDSGDSDKKAA